ncbi:hypothetical protein HF086_009884, partial [Spodoptera exigua]
MPTQKSTPASLTIPVPKESKPPVRMQPRPLLTDRTWANVVSAPKDSRRTAYISEFEATTGSDEVTIEMLQILNIIKRIKTQFISCPTMMDKVILVLTHLDLAVCDLSSDIIAVNETRINEQVPLHIPGYSCYRQDKRHDGRGQGVAILIRSNIPHSQVCVPVLGHLEAVGIEITVSFQKVLIFSIYQSPNLDILINDLETLLNTGKRVMLLGDFNARHPHWCCVGDTNRRGEVLFEHMLYRNYSIYAPSIPTLVHYCVNNKSSTPDLVIASNLPCVYELKAFTALSSNHLPVLLSLCMSVERQTYMQYKYSSADWQKYRTYLNNNTTLTRRTIDSVNTIENEVAKLTNEITKARDYFIPKVRIDYKPKPLPKFIKKMIKTKNKLKGREIRTNNSVERKILRHKINLLQFKIKSAVEIFNDKIWSDKMSKVDNSHNDLWRITKSLKNKSNTIPPLHKSNNQLTKSVSEQCNELANTFISNMSLTTEWSDDEVSSQVRSSMELINTTTVEK